MEPIKREIGPYRNRPSFIALTELLTDQVMYSAFDIIEKRRPNTTFRRVFRKTIKQRKSAFPRITYDNMIKYYRTEAFFPILQTVAHRLTHGYIKLTEKQAKDINFDTPIHEFFDLVADLYVAKKEKQEGRKKK